MDNKAGYPCPSQIQPPATMPPNPVLACLALCLAATAASALSLPTPARLLPWLPMGRRSPAGDGQPPGRLHSEAAEAHRVRSLPGWGKLSTRLYSGEVPISKDKAMFYALVEADCRRPEEAPVVLWLTGWVGWVGWVGGGWALGICLQLALRLVTGAWQTLSRLHCTRIPATQLSPFLPPSNPCHRGQRARLLLGGHRIHRRARPLLPPSRLHLPPDAKPVQVGGAWAHTLGMFRVAVFVAVVG